MFDNLYYISNLEIYKLTLTITEMKLHLFYALATVLLCSSPEFANSLPAIGRVPSWCNPSHGMMNGWLNFCKLRKWCEKNGYSKFGRYNAMPDNCEGKGKQPT